MPRIRTSRRVPPLKDSDYDHEITLVDDAPSETSTQRGQSPVSEESEAEAEASASRGPSAEASSSAPIVNRIPPTPSATAKVNRSESRRSKRSGHSRRDSRVSRKSVESAIDILYENERGGILCGIPLFSSRALGNLDPTAWTNAAHKPSLTDTKTATVPDPSWEWTWPEWKVNHDVGMDQDGWEYSFMFCRKFSWHGPKWWNSFVRRRAWIRRRIRRHHGHCSDQNDDPCLLNPDYFTVRPVSVTARSRSASIASRASSARDSRRSLGHLSQDDGESLERRDIEDIETLLQILKRSRIDREKIEAVGNYLEHSKDNMKCLHENMHDIMALFVFQSSRQILLSRLMQIYDKTKDELQEQDTLGLQERVEHLSEAVKHADEEVRKLEYWSDIKGMAERGESVGAVDSKRGWGEQWKGLDQSGPTPLKPKLETNGKH